MQRLNRPGFIALRSGWLWAGSWRNIFRPSNISLVTWALYLPQFRFPRSGQTHGPLPRARTRRSAAQGTHPDTGGWRQRHLRESDPEDPEVFLSKDVEAKQPHIRSFVKRAVTFGVCPGREGARPTAAARESRIDGISIADACAMQVSDLAVWLRDIEEPSVTPLLAFLRETLDAFARIGLGHLSLDRPSETLSGGEAQRTRTVRHLGSSPTDITYVFDEPSTGLHPHDVQRMGELPLEPRDKGNTVLAVEHEPELIAIADHVVDLGPGAGHTGGLLAFEGTPADMVGQRTTMTGRRLAAHTTGTGSDENDAERFSPGIGG